MASNHPIQKGLMRVRRGRGFRIVAGHRVIRQAAQRFAVAARSEELKGADSDMAGGDARQNRARHRRVAPHMLARRRDCQRPRGGNAQSRHGLADDVFAQHRAKGRAPVAAARERRRPGALQLKVATHAMPVDDLAEKNRAPVAELRDEAAELMAGIGGGDRVRALWYALARKDLGTFGRLERIGIDPQIDGKRAVELDEAWFRDWCR